MKKLLFLMVLVVGGGLLYWHFNKPKPVSVLLGIVGRGDIESTVVNTRAGTIKACRRALLAPASGGQIAQLLAKEGMRVESGDTLLTLWNKDLEAQITLNRSEAQASLSSARSACLEAETANRQAERFTVLRRNKVASEEEVDRFTSLAKVRQAACEAARSAAQVRQDQVEASLAQLQRTVLLAPFAGIVAEVNGEIGEYVTPSPPGIQTLPAVDLVDDSCFYVSAPIDEVDAAAIRVDMEARISLDAFSDRPFKGRVRRIADYVLEREKQARTVDIEVAFVDSPEGVRLLPGYSADAEVILQTRQNTLRIPAEALTAEGKVYLFHAEDGRLEERAVRKGVANLEFVEIIDGVKEGERLVLTPERKGVKGGALAVEEGVSSPAQP